MERKREDAAGRDEPGPVATGHARGQEGNPEIIRHADSHDDAREREGTTRKAADEAAGGAPRVRDPATGMPEPRSHDGNRSDDRT